MYIQANDIKVINNLHDNLVENKQLFIPTNYILGTPPNEVDTMLKHSSHLRALLTASSVSLFLALSTALSTANANDDHAVSSTKLSDTIYLISGNGGNIGVSIGSNGTFMIDDKFAPMTDAILAEIKKLGGDVPKFVINTHWHADHTGGNENLGKKGAIIVAHENVRERLTQDNFLAAFNKKIPASLAIGLPVVTFNDTINFHLNGDEINVSHIANAHTDGDSIIHFTSENILHTGDIFFNGFYPFIDIAHGGSLKGMINASDTMLSMINDQTRIIPGHGPMANKADLKSYRDMLQAAYDSLKPLKSAGKSIDEAVAAKPLQALDAEWSDGIFKTNQWIGLVYNGLD